MATASIGCIGAFNPADETFISYQERLEEYLLANNIGTVAAKATVIQKAAADRKKVAVLTTVIGPKVYGTLRDLCTPNTPKDKSFTNLCVLLQNFYKPKTLEVAETFKFNQCKQQDGESVSGFMAWLRRLSASCEFGGNLTRRLRDQFVSGVKNTETRKKLLQKDHILDECLTAALADEASIREVEHLGKQLHVEDAHHMKYTPRFKKNLTPSTKKSKYRCFSCGGSSHKRDKCKFRDAVCHRCGKKGHTKKACIQKSEKSDLHQMTEEPEEQESLYNLDIKSDGSSIIVPMQIEGVDVKMQLDTGCSLSLIPKTLYDEKFQHIPLQPTNVTLTTYTGEKLEPNGRFRKLQRIDVFSTTAGHSSRMSTAARPELAW